MAKKTATSLPSKTDLFAALKTVDHNSSNTASLQRLQEKHDKARKALADYSKKNKELQRLEKALEKAGDELYGETRTVRETVQKRTTKCRNLIRLEGVTPRTVAEVKLLLETYQSL